MYLIFPLKRFLAHSAAAVGSRREFGASVSGRRMELIAGC